MKTWFFRLFLLAILVGGVYFGWQSLNPQETVEVKTAPIDKGTLELLVTTTGKLSPTTEVVVGCEVSGTVEAVMVDHNDRVARGGVLARLAPEMYRAEHEQAKAELARATAEHQRLRVQADEVQREYERTKSLYDAQVENANAYRAAEAAWKAAKASADAGKAVVDNAESKMQITGFRLDRSVVTSPIDGIVLDRRVDVGQTIAATLQSPTLFVLAEDLGRMELLADVSEADIGYLCPGQPATFTVDAYRERQFRGTVRQIRNQPRTVRDVVTYTVVVDVRNEDRLLRPGMTADINIRVVQRQDVAKIVNAALRFRPPLPADETRSLLEALTWPPAPPPLVVSADIQTTRAAAESKARIGRSKASVPADFAVNPPPIDPVKATLWQYVGEKWQPRGVWTWFTDNRETAVYTGDGEAGKFVVEARKQLSSRSRLQEVIMFSRPENRVSMLMRKK